MKIPLEWLKEYVEPGKNTRDITNAFTMVGLLLDKPVTKYAQNGYETEILDLEHRMDRSDWLAIIGCARDLSAYFGVSLKYPKRYTDKPATVSAEDKIDIKVDCPELVNRFNTRVFKNITVKQSPNWLKNRLEAYGIPSINNIVDITNYVMVEFGQPMHAQDIAKMRKKEIHIRRAKKGESLTTFLGEEVKLDESTFVLSQAGVPTVIGGIVGGKETGVDEKTKSIVLDAGNYDQVNIRQSSRKLKIQNETVLRYDKFLHPHLTQVAIERATLLILELAGGEVFFNEDYVSEKASLDQNVMTMHKDRLSLISGMDIDLNQVEQILRGLEYEIVTQTHNSFEVKVPYFRTDVTVEDDIVSDILRINGYDKIKPLPMTGVVPKEATPAIVRFEDEIRTTAIKCGLNEYITSPFVEKNGDESQIVLINTINQGMNALRTSLEQTLRANLYTYTNNKLEINGIFEVGIAFTKNGHMHTENRHLQAIVYPQDSTLKTANKTKDLLATFMKDLGVNYEVVSENSKYIINSAGKKIGEIAYDNFYLDLLSLIEIPRENSTVSEKMPNYKTRDITLVSDLSSNGELITFIKKTYPEVVKLSVINGQYNKGEKSTTIGIKLYFAETTVDAEKVKNDILLEIKKRFNIDNKSLV